MLFPAFIVSIASTDIEEILIIYLDNFCFAILPEKVCTKAQDSTEQYWYLVCLNKMLKNCGRVL